MRLIDTKTLELKEFYDGAEIPNAKKAQLYSTENITGIPEYAILSHTWGSGEVTFQEMRGEREIIKQKPGFIKIRDSCKRARKDGHGYIWIDTCCIDKTSSTELTEAINSMYRWYKNSSICYAFLTDVAHNGVKGKSHFEDSRWFTRGWTLQELIAPLNVHFFDCDWVFMGTRHDRMRQISRLSNIDLYALEGGDLRLLSVSRRMSWAAKRQTTRLEDRAYCLLGIFNISMPLLYGEGANAFIRLQEEIMKVTDDQSLFAWADSEANPYRDDYPEASKPQGLLASSPDVFQDSRDTAQFHFSGTPGREVSVITNRGLQIKILMCRDKSFPSGLVYLAILDCQIGRSPGLVAGIRLRRLSPNGQEYSRVDMARTLVFGILDDKHKVRLEGFDVTMPQAFLYEINSKSTYSDWNTKNIFIPQDPIVNMMPAFWLMPPKEMSTFEKERIVAHPAGLWDMHTFKMQPQPSLGHGTKKLGAIYLEVEERECSVVFGVTGWEMKPWCSVVREVPLRPYDGNSRTKDFDFENWDLGRAGELRDTFNKFDVTDLRYSLMHLADAAVDMRSKVEKLTVMGKDIYVLRVSFK